MLNSTKFNNITTPTYASYLNDVNNNISKYFIIIETAFGVPGNLLSILVFSRLLLHHQKTNMPFLYIIQSVIDLNALVVSLFLYRSPILWSQTELHKLSDSLCKSWSYLRRLFLHMSSWMLVLTTFDRFTFVIYENRRFGFMRDKKVLVAIMITMFGLICLADVENLFYNLSSQPLPNPCTSNFAIVLSSDIVSILLRTYIPMALMLVFNLLMLRKIFESSRATFNQTSRSRKEYQFTISVLSVDIIFFITKFPLSVYYIYYDIELYSNALSSDPLFGAIINLIYSVILNLSFFDMTFSFFTNLAFNKLFRRKFFDLFSFLPFVGSIVSNSTLDNEHSANGSVICQQMRIAPMKSCLKTQNKSMSLTIENKNS